MLRSKSRTNRLQGTGHQLLQFVQAAIDSCSPLAFEHRLHHLSVLVRPGHGLRGHVVGLHHVRVQVWGHNKITRPGTIRKGLSADLRSDQSN